MNAKNNRRFRSGFNIHIKESRHIPRGKGLYAYLAGFAGESDECFPSISLMCEEMAMSKTRLYKHLDILAATGVIERKQTYNGNSKGKVIYKITDGGNSLDYRFPQNTETEKQYYSVYEKQEIPDMRNPQDKETNNNSFKNNSLKNNNNNKNTMCKADAIALFEQLWKLYPVKKGKAQVSLTAKQRLLKVGHEEIVRAIDRYKADLEKDREWRKPQNGSTFFNTGYVDYLDENYQEQQPGPPNKPESQGKDVGIDQWAEDNTLLDAVVERLVLPDDVPFK